MAGEPESLNTDEPLSARIERHNYDRLLMLSDGVFAIAITLLALDLRPPEVWPGGLVQLVVVKGRSLMDFGFGFAIVGAVWASHRALFARMRRVDLPSTLLALLLLALISLAPAVAALLAEFGPARALPVYLLLVVAIFLVQASLWGYAAYLGDLLHIEVTAAERRRKLIRLLIPAGVFGAVLLSQSDASNEVGITALALGVAVVLLVRLAIWARNRGSAA